MGVMKRKRAKPPAVRRRVGAMLKSFRAQVFRPRQEKRKAKPKLDEGW